MNARYILFALMSLFFVGCDDDNSIDGLPDIVVDLMTSCTEMPNPDQFYFAFIIENLSDIPVGTSKASVDLYYNNVLVEALVLDIPALPARTEHFICQEFMAMNTSQLVRIEICADSEDEILELAESNCIVAEF